MKRSYATRLLAAALLLAGACDGLGREVVDHQKVPPMGGLPPKFCTPPSCDAPIVEPVVRDSLATSLHEPSAQSCSRQFDSCSLGPMPTDGGIACQDENLDDPRLLSGKRIECAELEVSLPVLQGECSFEARGVELNHTRLRVRAEGGCTLSMPGLQASDARIELEGPVFFALGDRAVLDEVSFVGTRTGNGAPLLELELVEGRRVVVGDARQTFEGALHARTTRLVDSSMHTEELALESVLFDNAAIDSRQVDAVDAVIETAVIDLSSAVFSACSLHEVEIRSCSSLLIAGGQVTGSALRGCGDNLYRIYNTTLGAVALDGWVESDSSSFDGVQVGRVSQTDLVQFGGTLSRVVFCGEASSYRMGELAVVACARCDLPDVLEPGGACRVSEISPPDVREECPLLIQPRACTDEDIAPHRPRPPRPAMID